ncbi:MAG: preprotein translocase subunit SecG [Holosporaceae bacterium]|jgi:preprotein translocase subunit SecG|nr:preprotein translocase subunit SecG [Holosporaceae bacterium]
MSLLSFLLAVHFVLTITIIGLILLQKHDSDGALGSSGGGSASGMFSIRGQANILTRSTAVLMTIFVINCLLMAKIAKQAPAKESIIDRVAHESVPTQTNPVPANPPAVPTKGKSTSAPIQIPASTTKTPAKGKKK